MRASNKYSTTNLYFNSNENIRQFIALKKNNQIKNKLIIGLTSYKKFNY